MHRRGQRYIDGVRLFPGIYTPKWAFRVYNNMSGSVLREGAHKGPGRTPHPTTARLPPSKRTFYSRFPAIIPDLFSLDAHIRNKMPGTSSSSPAQIHCYFTAAPRWKADRGTHSSGGPAAGETDWTESGSPGLGFLLLFGVEAATGAVGSLSNWVEPETGSTH